MTGHDTIVATRYDYHRSGMRSLGFQAVCSSCSWSGPLHRWGAGDLPARELAERDRAEHP